MKCLSLSLYILRIPERFSYMQLSSGDIGDEHQSFITKTVQYV
jgi:hypothetical protein